MGAGLGAPLLAAGDPPSAASDCERSEAMQVMDICRGCGRAFSRPDDEFRRFYCSRRCRAEGGEKALRRAERAVEVPRR